MTGNQDRNRINITIFNRVVNKITGGLLPARQTIITLETVVTDSSQSSDFFTFPNPREQVLEKANRGISPPDWGARVRASAHRLVAHMRIQTSVLV